MQRLYRTSILGIAFLMLLFQYAAGASAQTKKKQPTESTAPNSKVDLNTASEKELDALPGVGPATAKKIIAARPYSSVDQLSKAGIPASTITKITPLVTVSGGSATSETNTSPQAQPETQGQASPPPSRKSSTSAASQQNDRGNPAPGMVWVNLDSGVYHYEGSRFYGKTKNGKYMSESDAINAGYHAAKNEKKPK
jgi:hypothetical protein